jgi:tetratricopeptide (TPR) repeat protein
MEQGRLVYIAVPAEKLRQLPGYCYSNSEFDFDADVPLPLELLPGDDVLKPETLSTEMILSGLLRELAVRPESEHAAYYRTLVFVLRPGITGELTGAAILKSKNGDHDTALEILGMLEGLYPRQMEDAGEGGALPLILLNKALILETRAETRAASTGCAAPRENAAPAGFAAAEAAWEEALALPLPNTLFYAGLFYYRQAEYRRAAELLGRYADGENKNAGEDAEKRAKARELLDEIRKDGLDDETFQEACALIRSGAEEKGILAARDFLERRPQSGKGWFALGWGLRRLSRWKDAAACFEKAAEYGLAAADTRNELAICLMETGDYDKAKRELESALRDDPENVKIISNLGALALRRGQEGEAAAFFRAALELAPDDSVAAAYLRLAQ